MQVQKVILRSRTILIVLLHCYYQKIGVGRKFFWGHEEQSLDCIDEDACDLPKVEELCLRTPNFFIALWDPLGSRCTYTNKVLYQGEKGQKRTIWLSAATRSVLCSQISPALVPNWCIIAPLPTKSHLIVDTKKRAPRSSTLQKIVTSSFISRHHSLLNFFVQYHKKIDKEIGAKGKSLCSQVLPFQKLRFLQIFCFYSLRL